MSREDAVLITLVAYKVILLGMGVLGARRTHDAADFFLGGRKLGPVVAAVSASASGASAWTMLGVSGAAYAGGLSAIWVLPACVGGIAFNWYVLAPGLRRLENTRNAITVTELLAGPEGRPYGRSIRWVASVIVLLSLGFYVCSQFLGAGKTFATTFDIPRSQAVLLGASIVVLYTLVGGFWAVSLTDTLQGLLMAGTAIIVPIVAMVEVGGVDALLEGLRGVEQPGFLSLTKDLPLMAGIGFVVGMLGIGLGFPGQPHIVNRLMALRPDPRSLVVARRVAVAWGIVVFIGMLVLGLAGRVLIPVLADTETVFVAATNQLFPPVLAGVMLAAVLSAIMSTADSQLLVAGSAVTNDLGLGGHSQRSLLLRSRLVVLALSAGAAFAAATTDETIFSQVLFAWGALGAAFGPLLVITVLRGPVSPGRTLAAMTAGGGLSIGVYYAFPEQADGSWKLAPYALSALIALWPSGAGRSARQAA